jgi:hypothetical protein
MALETFLESLDIDALCKRYRVKRTNGMITEDSQENYSDGEYEDMGMEDDEDVEKVVVGDNNVLGITGIAAEGSVLPAKKRGHVMSIALPSDEELSDSE